MPSRKIFAISGSLRNGSTNHRILQYLSELLIADIDFDIYTDLAQIPPFDPGLDNDIPPSAVTELRNKITNSDIVVICTPEYAFGVPGQLKNALDWTVSSSNLVEKKVILITASSVGDSAHASLLKTLSALNAEVIADLLIPFVRAKIDGNGNITDEGLRNELKIISEHLNQ